MNSKWVSGLSEQEKEDLKASILAAKPVFVRLSKLLKDKMAENDRRQLDKDGYASACWPYFQADCIGYHRALSELNKLITEVTHD